MFQDDDDQFLSNLLLKFNIFHYCKLNFYIKLMNVFKLLFHVVFNTSLGGCGHTSVKNILLY